MAVGNGTMIGSPVVHDRVDILEAVLRGVETRREPGSGPGGIGTAVEGIVDILRQVYGPTLGKLQHRAEASHEVQAYHGHGHSATCQEV